MESGAARPERCAGGVMRGRSDKAARVMRACARRKGERGGRGSHPAIRPIEKLVSSTVVMNRLQHIKVSQTSAVVTIDLDMKYRCS